MDIINSCSMILYIQILFCNITQGKEFHQLFPSKCMSKPSLEEGGGYISQTYHSTPLLAVKVKGNWRCDLHNRFSVGGRGNHNSI